MTMMRNGWLLLLVALSASGCLSSASHVQKESRKETPVSMVPAPPPPVTADQVNETNAPRMVQELARELDREDRTRTVAPVMALNQSLTNP